jgi:uncharacterized protein YktA (UPF0223 family)
MITVVDFIKTKVEENSDTSFLNIDWDKFDEIINQAKECVHMYLDDKQVPRQNNNGRDYSVVGRIKRLEASFQKQLSELESNYLTFKQIVPVVVALKQQEQ